ncbi:MAG: serine/threonine protein kinase, partial [Pirellulaceae bacterium]
TTVQAGQFTPPKPAQLAQHFPHLEILDLIGQGGMGAVYKARQRGLDRLVALKILPPDVGRDPAFAERFAREARALARLSHPNIVGIYDSGKAAGLYYLVMEYVDGICLREAIQTGELASKEVLAIVTQICDALQYAHDEGIVHRDIKPENVLLDRKGRVKIADFGHARLLGHAPENYTLTASNQVMGTPRYMAPEQMEGSHEVDHRADIYSLGVVFYELLTGELPLGRFAPPSKKVQVDVRLDEVVLRTLAKEPELRYQHASEIKTDVELIGGIGHFPMATHRMLGYEYRSPRELFGWPLVHIATGIDPRTGRKRVAKGIIAIGDVAVGGLFALGGGAVGPIAIGGCGVGLYTIGGASLGLFGALGGAAIGLGVSLGGLAIGTLAAGGGAVGYYAYGGGASGVHPWGANFQDEAAAQLWQGSPPEGVFLVGAALVPLVVILLCIVMASVLASQRTSDSRRQTFHDEPHHDRRHGKALGWGCLIGGMLLVPLLFLCVGLSVWMSYASRVQRDLASTVPPEPAVVFRVEFRGVLDHDSELKNSMPFITVSFSDQLRLDLRQHERVNEILQNTYQKYLDMEKEHVTLERNEMGTVITTIEPFPADLVSIADEMWTKLDELLDLDQERMMRQSLRLHPPRLTSHQAFDPYGNPQYVSSDLMGPGLLGWGLEGCRIEISKRGSWYHWKMVRGASINDVTHEGKGPELPWFLRRFWPGPDPKPDPNP